MDFKREGFFHLGKETAESWPQTKWNAPFERAERFGGKDLTARARFARVYAADFFQRNGRAFRMP